MNQPDPSAARSLELLEELAYYLQDLKLDSPAGTYSVHEMFARQLAQLKATVEHYTAISEINAQFTDWSAPQGPSIAEMLSSTTTMSGTTSSTSYSTTNFDAGITLFCNVNGCAAILKTGATYASLARTAAEVLGWYANDDLSRVLCPLHHHDDEGGVGAMVPSVPPSRTPGMTMTIEADPVA